MSADSLEGTNSFPEHRHRGALCGSIILSWVQGLEDQGVDLAHFFPAWGVDPAALRVGNLRLPLFLARRFWEVALEQSADPAIGLELARQLDPVQMQGLAYLMQLMPDRYSALQQMLHFWPLVAAHFEQRLEQDGDCLRLTLRPVNDYQLALPEVDYWMVRQLRHLRSAPGALPALREVRLRRPEPSDPRPWLQVIRAPVVFSSCRDEMLLDLAALQEPRDGGSPAIHEALKLSLREYAAQTETGSELERVCAEVLHRLADNPGLDEVAARLHMTPRTLHRALQRDGWTYSRIIEEHRRLLAVDLLQATASTIAEIADRLGFDEQSSFIRAFRRWYGATPGAYRMQRQ
ncbi:AraC family transcriptional regulator ligand-binding domain-containing protein [Pseudomonas sp. PDM17]|uniref:helix-turn-helix transcriptional regulator n=1 Tax=unclassified Pseudomonas TaxID=196821 RepID=UPI0017818880|nr:MULTISPECIES: AraC family transcriptional regulator [unclassified Pseudomonas]MBD9500632.1 AraC family transcriptional regulator ligand-binding domain-containing protein [Pseudomonas sp. PDM17]